jgi:membrane associated rhomboid family serine protease
VGSIIAICAGVFMWHGVKDQELQQKRSKEAEQALEKFDDNMVLSLKNIREGRYYTILTSTFVHTSPVHLFVNMMTLWSFGRTFIYVYGLPTFALVYAGAGIAGGALQLYAWSKSEPQIFHRGMGASGSLLGVLAAWAIVMPREPIQMFFIPMKLGPAMGGFAVASVAFIYTGALPFIGHWDHLGGMAFGAFWWLVALRRGVRFRGGKR